ncbi:MAG TPA: N-acetylglucosamine-6-phosphate deacetylase [Candidatus Sulfopaludibacter sp.]|jgi:N-acetylglucosamine-6-phosphate deacetylase|nr:N-acetylglucosamine-6-phosphate deacetylase [Candidatus Sulfopaludibacter sp.]
MNCFGRNPATGAILEVAFHDVIETVTASEQPTDLYLAPGWIDLQVNGFAGVDYNNAATPHAEIERSLHTLFSTGVTRFYPTVITGAPDSMTASLRNLAAAREALPNGEAMEGFHVEGPFISPEEGPRGAHPKQWVRKPDLDEYRRWQDAAAGRVRIVTLAPEWPEAPRFIEEVTSQGVVVSIGHTQATSAQIADAVSAGATLSTHLGNGAHGVMRRHPNYIWDQLAEDRLMADFIVDGIHLDAAFLKVAVRAKTVDRSVLVTDAAPPAAAAPGRYYIADQPVDLREDGRVVLAGQERLAGSALRMDRGIENLMRLAGLALGDAVRMATVNAARAGKVAGRAAGVAPGDRADLVQFRYDAGRIAVAQVWISGQRVFAAD